MRKLYSTVAIIFLLACNNIKAQYVSVPDGAFVTWMNTNYPGSIMYDINGPLLDTTNAAMRSVQSVSISDLYPGMDGFPVILSMQWFVSCTSFSISGQVSTGTFPPGLISLSWTAGDVVPALPLTLRHFTCINNQWLSSLPVLPATLKYLDCRNNYLTSLDVAGINLDTLICGNQHSYAPYDNILTSVAVPPSIKYLDFSDAALSSVPALPNSLRYLNCSSNNHHLNPEDIVMTMNSLPDHLPDSLRFLICGGNALTSIPDLPPFFKLFKLCGNKLC